MTVFRSPVFSDCTTTCAVSHRVEGSDALDASVNSRWSPSGSICGPWATSPFLTLTTASGLPPAAGTRMMPPAPWPKKIQSRSQAMSKGFVAGAMVTAAPPLTAILMIEPEEVSIDIQNAID
jgi:hypothetical protein